MVLECTKKEESRVANKWKNDIAIYEQSKDYKASKSGEKIRSSVLVI